MEVLQTSALPLGYGATVRERSMALGFSEPGRNRRNIVTFRKTKGKQFRCKDLQPTAPEEVREKLGP